MAVAYYYQEFILGTVGPQEVPMIEVAIALDLKSEGTVSDYKKELQRRIWGSSGTSGTWRSSCWATGCWGRPILMGHGLAPRSMSGRDGPGRAEAARERLRHRQRNKA
jgi:hypothetical protein